MKKAFTLAEVLITLGIIGVVAAMTLPSVINQIQNKQYKVAYKKAYSGLSQAFLSMQANDEYLDMTPEYMNEGVGYTKNSGENFKVISRYFKSQKKCFENNANECWECDNGEAGYISGGAPKWLGCAKRNYAFIDNSGMAWYMYSNNEWPIIVDVNGFSKPNKLGKDRFVMLFASNQDKSYYLSEADKVMPWSDQILKGRWCPSGNCFYKSWLAD